MGFKNLDLKIDSNCRWDFDTFEMSIWNCILKSIHEIGWRNRLEKKAVLENCQKNLEKKMAKLLTKI
jgi:hypothetical protein